MAKEKTTNKNLIWLLVDGPDEGDLSRYAAPLHIDAERLGKEFQTFTSAISKVLEKFQAQVGEFELTEVTIKASIDAEIGFVLISKASFAGGLDLTFQKKSNKP